VHNSTPNPAFERTREKRPWLCNDHQCVRAAQREHSLSSGEPMAMLPNYKDIVESCRCDARRRLEKLDPTNPGGEMKLTRIVGIFLIVAGILGVVFSSFSFTKETHEIKLGPVELAVKEKQAVDIPTWASVSAIVVGGLLVAFGGRKG
jgi:hypothetical protein